MQEAMDCGLRTLEIAPRTGLNTQEFARRTGEVARDGSGSCTMMPVHKESA